jgi:hypothetical protein
MRRVMLLTVTALPVRAFPARSRDGETPIRAVAASVFVSDGRQGNEPGGLNGASVRRSRT